MWLLVLATAATVCADTKIMLPDFKRFAAGEKKFIVETTMPGDFKSLHAIVLALLTLSPQAANNSVTAPFFDKAQPLYRDASLHRRRHVVSRQRDLASGCDQRGLGRDDQTARPRLQKCPIRDRRRGGYGMGRLSRNFFFVRTTNQLNQPCAETLRLCITSFHQRLRTKFAPHRFNSFAS
jgi:hypothetical protein